jgi:hypothetical protein
MNTAMNWISIVFISLSAMLAGCLTMPRNQEVTYVPGSDPAVQTAKASMTESNAVDFLGRYIVQYVDKATPESSTSDPFSQALTARGRKPTVTTNGYCMVKTSVVRWGNQMTVQMKREDHQFADVTRVALVNRTLGESTRPVSVIFYGKNNEKFLECNVDGSETLIPRVLAAAEKLCPNIGKEGQVLPVKTTPAVPR